MSIRSKMRTNSKSKRRSIKRQRGGNLIKHGRTCESSEIGTYKRVTINGKKVDLICKKSKQIFGKKVKSSLKKKNGTFSLGKYGKTLNSEKCMKGPCWHKLSSLNKVRKRYKKRKNSLSQTKPAYPPSVTESSPIQSTLGTNSEAPQGNSALNDLTNEAQRLNINNEMQKEAEAARQKAVNPSANRVTQGKTGANNKPIRRKPTTSRNHRIYSIPN